MIRPVALLVLAAPPAFADAALRDLRIERPMRRDTPPVAAGFVAIETAGTTDVTLVSAAIDADFVGTAQRHRLEMENGVMEKSEASDGIAIPAEQIVTLAPGGLHIVLMGLTAPLMTGESFPVTPTFAEAGELVVDFPVMDLGQVRAAVAAAGLDIQTAKGS